MIYYSIVQKKYISYFPEDYSPSKSQIKLINGVEQAFTRGNKFVICCAPTGTGKSFLAQTLANVSSDPTKNYIDLINSYDAFRQDYSGNYIHEPGLICEPAFGTFALTITKSLQDQYLKLFKSTKILKGKSNYQCAVDTNYDVETAPCVLTPSIKEDCWQKNLCPYYTARNKALTSKFAVLNYKMFLSLPSHVKRKSFLICDEASELEDEIAMRFTAFIDYEKLKNYGIIVSPLVTEFKPKARVWLYNLIFQISEILAATINRHNKKKSSLSHPDKIKIVYLKNLYNLLTKIESLWDDCEFVIEKNANSVTFTPLKVDKLSKYIFNYGEHVLLMSATIIDHKNFAKTLGIEKYEYVEVDSSFEPTKSPIYVTSKNKLNYKNIKFELPEIVSKINKICTHHKDQKGIIHTHTNEITTYLKSRLEGERFLYRTEGYKNEDILQNHLNSPNSTILVSPSLSFGIDLKDDLARFQIIVKLPFLPLSNKRIKKLYQIDSDWYINKMLNALVQACGRATRSKQDYAVTYILDGNTVEILKKYRSRLPKYFLDRIH